MEETTDQPKTYTINEMIPMEVWGKDHWSTLAYIETKIVDFGFRIQADPRMRTNLRRNWRIAEHKARKGIRYAISDGSTYPTRLNNGTVVEGHDDWECLQDMYHAGLLSIWGGPDLGRKVKLTKLGLRVVHQIREHKAKGGNFATFTFDPKKS